MKQYDRFGFSIAAALIGVLWYVQAASQDAAAPTVRALAPGVAEAILPVDERVARLEAALVRANGRIDELEARFKTHVHAYTVTQVGLLREPINGRPIDLAIGPQVKKRITEPPSP